MTRNIKIKDLPKDERPRERLAKLGGETLSIQELLAIILRTGTKGETAIDIANRLLHTYNNNLYNLFSADVHELSRIKGVGFTKAVQLKAVFEIHKKLSTFTGEKDVFINRPEDVYFIMKTLQYAEKEYFILLSLNARNKLISKDVLSVGTLNIGVVEPREVFRMALAKNAASIVLVHNHPSGDCTPSDADIQITKRIVEGGRILGIDVQDHVIIGKNKYYSIRERCNNIW